MSGVSPALRNGRMDVRVRSTILGFDGTESPKSARTLFSRSSAAATGNRISVIASEPYLAGTQPVVINSSVSVGSSWTTCLVACVQLAIGTAGQVVCANTCANTG